MTLDAAVAPNLTALIPAKLVPVIVTLVPPAPVPLVGLMPVTVGVLTMLLRMMATRWAQE